MRISHIPREWHSYQHNSKSMLNSNRSAFDTTWMFATEGDTVSLVIAFDGGAQIHTLCVKCRVRSRQSCTRPSFCHAVFLFRSCVRCILDTRCLAYHRVRQAPCVLLPNPTSITAFVAWSWRMLRQANTVTGATSHLTGLWRQVHDNVSVAHCRMHDSNSQQSPFNSFRAYIQVLQISCICA